MSGQGGIAVLISAVQVYIAIMGVYAASDDAGSNDSPDGSPSTAELASGMGLWMAAIVPIAFCIITTRRLFPRGAGAPSSSASEYPKLSFERTNEDGEFYDTERRFSAEEDEESRRGSTRGFHRSWAIMKRNKVINFSVAYVFIVTLVCYLLSVMQKSSLNASHTSSSSGNLSINHNIDRLRSPTATQAAGSRRLYSAALPRFQR